MSKKYVLNDGDDFILEAKDKGQAQRNAEYYHAKVIGLLYDPHEETVFGKDQHYDWSQHIKK